jgi:CRP/FNR family transcriptional regulator, nitrogen fixation regulation protein
MEGRMYQQVVTGRISGISQQPVPVGTAVARSGRLDALVALEQIGTRHSFSRDKEIYAEGDASDCWYRVVSGAVRICKWMADGRRHIAEFCFAGDCFGLPASGTRAATAEAIGDVVVMRYPQRAADRLIDETPRLAREMYNRTLRELTHTQTHTLVLSRMTASERLASFLLEMAERRDTPRAVELPMSRYDIADYLGLTMETVCRTFTAFRRDGVIALPTPQRVELCDRDALETLVEA